MSVNGNCLELFGIKDIDVSNLGAISWCCSWAPGSAAAPTAQSRVSSNIERSGFGDSRCGVGIYFHLDETGALVVSSLDSEGNKTRRPFDP